MPSASSFKPVDRTLRLRPFRASGLSTLRLKSLMRHRKSAPDVAGSDSSGRSDSDSSGHEGAPRKDEDE